MDSTESKGRSRHEDDHNDHVWETRRHEFVLALNQLPRAQGWNEFSIYRYQGFWFPQFLLPGVMCFQQHFQAHDEDIILASYPKAGTTWLKALVFSIVHRDESEKLVGHELRQQKDNPLLTSSPHALVPFFELQVYNDGEPNESYLNAECPRLFSTHIPYASLADNVKSSKCKIVYISRNPLDVVVSFWHFARRSAEWSEGWTLEEFVSRFCGGVFACGPFTDHVVGYWRESLERPEKVLFLRYEDMKADTVTQVKGLAGFPFTKEEESRGVIEEILRLCSFDNLQSLEVNQPGNYSMPGLENSLFFRKW